jgi:hypothetical protein
LRNVVNAENIALQISQILYTFVLRAEIATTFGPKMVTISARNIQKYIKFANFARLYFPHFTTFRNHTLQFYSSKYALSSCGDLFASPCLVLKFSL